MADHDASEEVSSTYKHYMFCLKLPEDIILTTMEARGDIDELMKENSLDLFLVAAGLGYSRVLDTLCSAGADVHRKHKTGHTAMYFATMRGHEECIRVLMKHGADVHK